MGRAALDFLDGLTDATGDRQAHEGCQNRDHQATESDFQPNRCQGLVQGGQRNGCPDNRQDMFFDLHRDGDIHHFLMEGIAETDRLSRNAPQGRGHLFPAGMVVHGGNLIP